MAPMLNTVFTQEPESLPAVTFESQIAVEEKSPLPYTSNPLMLFGSDLLLLLKEAWALPFIVIPLWPWRSGSLDELYPSVANVFAIIVHTVLIITQTLFLILLGWSLFTLVPTSIVVSASISFLVANYYVCNWLLNGREPILKSKVDLNHLPKHDDEKWIFINGVAAGQHWLQSNIDRIAMTFGRPVTGVHNPTAGIMFDLIQCIIQRDFSYVTEDIRTAYLEVKKSLSPALNERSYSKVVLILHSQGGIEGGLILDWLLAELSSDELAKLEIYTFGNAANHFNNPVRTDSATPGYFQSASADGPSVAPRKCISHIEHYANHSDFVSRWGVLHFASKKNSRLQQNRYAGHIFERPGRGHQFNQHYLDNMFPLGKMLTASGKKVWAAEEQNRFMQQEIQVVEEGHVTKGEGEGRRRQHAIANGNGDRVVLRGLTVDFREKGSRSLLSPKTRRTERTVADMSRLWEYRNGRSPTV